MPRRTPEQLPIPDFYRAENAASWSFAPAPDALAPQGPMRVPRLPRR